MLRVADIAKRAYDDVAGKIAGVIHEGTLKRVGEAVYDPVTGRYEATEETDSCRVIFDNERPVEDLFPAYVPGPKDQLAYIEGLTEMQPREGDTLEATGKSFAVTKVSDILHAGEFYSAIVTG